MSLPREGSRVIREGVVISVPYDWCRSPDCIVPYKIHTYSKGQTEGAATADSVRQTDVSSHVKGSKILQCYGDEPGVGGGVLSGTHNAECEPKTWSSSVRAEDRNMVRHDDEWWMNHKNTWGKLVYLKDTKDYDTPEAKDVKPRMRLAQAATGVMNDGAPLGAGEAAIPRPGIGAGIVAGGLAMQQVDQLRKDSAIQGAAQTLGLDLSQPNDVLAASAYVWGKNIAPMPGNYSEVPFSGPENEAVARSIANTERAHPGTLAGAQRGNKDDKKRLDDAVKVGLAAAAAKDVVRVSRKDETKHVLCHYTSATGLAGILASQQILPSLKAINPADARYGDGQYFTDIPPGTQSNASLSATFIRNRFQGQRFSHYVCIDTKGLHVVQGRSHVFVVPNSRPLGIEGRVQSSGKN